MKRLGVNSLTRWSGCSPAVRERGVAGGRQRQLLGPALSPLPPLPSNALLFSFRHLLRPPLSNHYSSFAGHAPRHYSSLSRPSSICPCLPSSSLLGTPLRYGLARKPSKLYYQSYKASRSGLPITKYVSLPSSSSPSVSFFSSLQGSTSRSTSSRLHDYSKLLMCREWLLKREPPNNAMHVFLLMMNGTAIISIGLAFSSLLRSEAALVLEAEDARFERDLNMVHSAEIAVEPEAQVDDLKHYFQDFAKENQGWWYHACTYVYTMGGLSFILFFSFLFGLSFFRSFDYLIPAPPRPGLE